MQINQQSMYLTVASSGECLGPSDGKFLLSHFDTTEEFEVHGDVSSHTSSSSHGSSSTIFSSRPCMSSPSILTYSTFQSVSILANPRRPTYTSSRSRSSVNVHVVFADIFRAKKKVEFVDKEQAYIPVSEAQANVPSVLAAVREKWGQNVEIVTNNGLPVVDEPGTRGKSVRIVWKTSRQFSGGVVQDVVSTQLTSYKCNDSVGHQRRADASVPAFQCLTAIWIVMAICPVYLMLWATVHVHNSRRCCNLRLNRLIMCR